MDEHGRHTGGDEVPPKFAVLIDADNAQAAMIEGLLTEVASYGEATVRRIYGDFTSTHSSQWKKVLNRYAIKPVQQFAYTTGKNATDSTLIIDAMDLLYSRKFDGFCLVSSDSDFTGLALRIREEGLTVLGFGERKTPDAFRNACHKFVFTELLRAAVAGAAPAGARPAAVESGTTRAPAPAAGSVGTPASAAGLAETPAPENAAPEQPGADQTSADQPQPVPLEFMLQALENASDETGWATLSAFGSYLNKLQPDFDSRLYGYKKLSDLVRAEQSFQLKERALPGSGKHALYLRAR